MRARELLAVAAAWLCFHTRADVTLRLPGLGALRGALNTSHWSNRTIFQFQGIPFAKPPVGDLRFKPPEPVGPWNGTLDATKFGNKCPVIQRSPQESDLRDLESYANAESVEDCLNLNVYTPKLGNSTPGVAVMVYIHGGSFRVGSAQEFWPSYLLEKEVVLVVPQYRLGPLDGRRPWERGAPGPAAGAQMGPDLHLSLRRRPQTSDHLRPERGRCGSDTHDGHPTCRQELVREGGRAERVGAGHVGHGLAPRSQRARHRQACQLHASRPRRPRSLPAGVVSAGPAAGALQLPDRGPPSGGKRHGRQPSCDPDCRISQVPGRASSEELAGRQVPAGADDGRGHPARGELHPDIYDIILQHYNLLHNKDFIRHNLTRATLKFSGIEDPTGMVTDVLNEKYFQPGQLGDFNAMVPGLVDICGVALLKASTFRSVLENSRQQPSYLYSFNYYGQHTKFGYGEDVEYPFQGGVSHSDDLIYLFPQHDFVLNSQDEAVARTMVELWTNFAIYGKPSPAEGVPEWPPVSTEAGPYLRIDRMSEVRPNFLDEYMIAVTGGLGPSGAPLVRFSTPALLLWLVATGLVL
ncbi:juvenile hormone esterase-like isoform X2 [Periplaneta americana]|uniref:juvenile hormone esterase-like isoform X2 n=1 Tax=Periplaneta americana TaxID=6978 RepID=UPI0037E9732D